MTDHKNHPEFNREHDLAEFTDQVLSSQASDLSEDQRYTELEDLVLAIKDHTPDQPPDEIKQRIKKNAQAAYTQTYLNQQEEKAGRSFFGLFGRGAKKQGYRSQSQRQRAMVSRLAVTAAIVVAAAALLLPSSGTPGGYSGAASGALGFWLPVIVLILAAVLIAWLWLKD